jgi:hypothetical protein
VIVLDASAALELLLVTDKGSRVTQRIAPPEEIGEGRPDLGRGFRPRGA